MTLPQIHSVPEIRAPVSIVVVGGVDPGGGAGLLRDVATAAALGARSHVVGTAWTEQGEGYHRVEPRAPEAVGAALAQALATLRPAATAPGVLRPAATSPGLESSVRPAAVKIGMAVGPATAATLVEALAGFAGPVVVDPVLATSRGGALWAGAPRELLPLLRRATLVTPNAIEAAALAGRPVATVAEAEAAGRHLVEVEGLQAVLVKGGHLADAGVSGGPPVDSGGSLMDLLVTSTGTTRYPHPRVPGPSPRGTGCALATAIAVELGRGRPLGEAVQTAIDWLVATIAAATSVGDERHLPHDARRKALRSPHPESGRLAEEGFSEWARSLPDEEISDLVDLGSGTPVRWIPDEGWVRRRK